MRRLWRTHAGVLLCAVLTRGQHIWLGWSAQPGYRRGWPLPMAHCTRCGREF